MRKTMIALTSAALMSPGMATARADGMPAPALPAAGIVGTMHAPGERQTRTVRLVAGRDYALAGWVTTSDVGAELLFAVQAAGGRGLCGEAPLKGYAFAQAEHVGGCTFRAPYSGGYTLVLAAENDGEFPYDYKAWLQRDCAAGRSTQCAISVNHAHQQLVDYDGDVDWYATRLQGGVTYKIAAEASPFPWVDVTLRSSSGAVIASAEPNSGVAGRTATLTVRAPASGAYFVEVDDISGQEARFGYSLSLSRVR